MWPPPPPHIQTFPHPEFVYFLLMLACFCRAGTRTDWLRSLVAGSSLCRPPILSSASAPPTPSLYSVSLISCFFTKPSFFYVIKRNLDTFTVISDYINPEVHRVRGLIMVVSYIPYKSADNAGCSK